jgi:hypothetical protein
METFFANPFALLCLVGLTTITLCILAIPRLFGLFKTNSFTGRVRSMNRIDEDRAITLQLESLSGSGVRTFVAPDPLGEEIERLLFSYRQNRQPVVMTVEFDPRDGVTLTGYSIIKQP